MKPFVPTFLLFVTLFVLAQYAFAQVPRYRLAQVTKQNQDSNLPQKYNGYGLPNTKFKKLNTRIPNPERHSSPLAPTLTEAAVIERYVKLEIEFVTSFGLQAEKQKDGTQSQYLYYELNPKIQVGYYTAGMNLLYNQDLRSSSADWGDSTISFNRKAWELGDYLKLTPIINLGFLYSKSTKENTGMTGSLGPALNLGLNTTNLDLPHFYLNYSFGYTKLFTDRELDKKGDPNVDYRLRQRINLGYAFTEKFGFRTRFQFDSIYAKDDFVTNNFLHFQQFDYTVLSWLGVFLGHSNSNSLFNSETEANNLKYYDSATSEWFAGFALIGKNY